MGILDIPIPLLNWIDGLLSSFLGPGPRLAFWAVLGAVLSMLIYRLLTPQRRIAGIERITRRLRRRLDQHEGELREGFSLIGKMLRLSLERLRLVVGPALVGALPIIFLVVWASTSFDAMLPRNSEEVTAKVVPSSYTAVVSRRGGAPDVSGSKLHVTALDRSGQVVESLPIKAPVTQIHKWTWWNILVGNPAGYLPSDGPVDLILLDLPRARYLPFGPDWLRGWEALFFGVTLLAALALKFALKIR